MTHEALTVCNSLHTLWLNPPMKGGECSNDECRPRRDSSSCERLYYISHVIGKDTLQSATGIAFDPVTEPPNMPPPCWKFQPGLSPFQATCHHPLGLISYVGCPSRDTIAHMYSISGSSSAVAGPGLWPWTVMLSFKGRPLGAAPPPLLASGGLPTPAASVAGSAGT